MNDFIIEILNQSYWEHIKKEKDIIICYEL